MSEDLKPIKSASISRWGGALKGAQKRLIKDLGKGYESDK